MTEHIKAWLAALRSGKYSQTTTVLRDARGFCCLGVACDLDNPDKWSSPNRFGDFSYLSWKRSLPPSIEKKLGFGFLFYTHLAALNDEVGFDFNMIADYIEGKVNNGTAFKL